MTDQSTELSDLIADARLVLAYGARSGRLPSKSLAEAMARASSGSADNKGTEDHIMALASALNESIQAIAPITLKDLGSKWQPFPYPKGGRSTRIAYSFLAVVLVVATAYYTQVYSQLNSILLVLRDIQTQNAIDKAERLFRYTSKNHQDIFSLTEKEDQIGKKGQAEKKDQGEIIFEPYLTYYLDLLRLNDQVTTYVPLSDATAREILNPLKTIYSWFRPDSIDPKVEEQLPKNNSGVGNYGPVDKKLIDPVDPKLEEQFPQNNSGVGKNGPKVKKDHPSLVQDRAKTDDAVPVNTKLINKQMQLTNFLYILGLGRISPSVPNDTATGSLETVTVRDKISNQIYECEKLTALLGIWVLPAMYGLLGAVVFQMRAVLNPLIPDPPLERLLIRFALGALAGVSISWLFGDVPAKSSQVQSMHTTLFGFSFLLGFSIDVFFALLDRTVEMLSNSIVKKDK